MVVMSRVYLFPGLICWKRRNKVAKKSVFSVYCTQIFLCSAEAVERRCVCSGWLGAGGLGQGGTGSRCGSFLGGETIIIAAGTVC